MSSSSTPAGSAGAAPSSSAPVTAASSSAPLPPAPNGSVAAASVFASMRGLLPVLPDMPSPEVADKRRDAIMKKIVDNQGPHRCASRLDDFAFSIYNFNFETTSSRFALFTACARSNVGDEPRDAHINVPQSRLPQWDPQAANYNPYAPYDSFPKKLKRYQPPTPQTQ